jgi:hypothetical protein
MAKIIQVDGDRLTLGLAIMQGIAEFQPYSSISFPSSEKVLTAVDEVSELVNWGMAKNKQKMKETTLEILDHISEVDPGEPVNLNLDDYELKSIAAAADLIERTLDEKKEGIEITNRIEE